jgi:hypothetical protein
VLIVLAAVIVAGALLKAATLVVSALSASRSEGTRSRAVELLSTFAPGVAAAEHDPRALLAWEPLARTARRALPEEFALLDQASGRTFPFTRDRLQAAHAAWTAEWLSWERRHDAEYKLKAAIAEHELKDGSLVGRAKLEAIERDKLDLYQQHYQDYIKVAKALQALLAPPT